MRLGRNQPGCYIANEKRGIDIPRPLMIGRTNTISDREFPATRPILVSDWAGLDKGSSHLTAVDSQFNSRLDVDAISNASVEAVLVQEQ